MSTQMVCGGIYEWSDAVGRKLQGTLVSITSSPTGVVEGTLLSTGFAPEIVRPDTERWGKLTLIGRPASPKVGRPKKKA